MLTRTRAVLAAALALAAVAPAQPLEITSLHQFGTPQTDEAYGVTPSYGSVVGGTQGSLFGPNAGQTDAFWAFIPGMPFGDQFGSTGVDVALAITVVQGDDFYIVGFTDGDFAGPSAGATDGFVKFEGHVGSALRRFGTPAPDSARAVAPGRGDSTVFVAGITRGSLASPSAGGEDAWLAHVDVFGGDDWTRQFGTAGDDLALAAAQDDAGGVYVAGYTTGALGGPNAGSIDAFVARYDDAGNQLWVRQLGTSSYDQAVAAAPDGSGGVYIAGGTGGSLGGPNAGSRDGFLARYNAAGALLWVRQLGTSNFDDITALAPQGTDGVFVAGYTFGSLAAPNLGSRDAFVARYDNAGNRTASLQFGTAADDGLSALAADGFGGVYAAGSTFGNLGGAGSAGGSDAFVANLRLTCDPDVNADGNSDQDDVQCIINAVAGNPGCSARDADFNRDGNVDQEDVLAVINAVAGGGCP